MTTRTELHDAKAGTVKRIRVPYYYQEPGTASLLLGLLVLCVLSMFG